MAFNPDFGQANEAISKAAMAFMQDWVGRQNDARSMEYLKSSGDIWETKAQEDAKRELARMAFQHKQTLESKDMDFINEAAKLPEFRGVATVIQRKRMLGQDYTKELGELQNIYDSVKGRIEGLTKGYDVSGENVTSLFSMFENPQEIVVQGMRGAQDKPAQALEWAKLNWEKAKDRTGKVDDARKGYLKKISDLREFYTRIRNGNTIVFLDPKTNLPREIDKTQLTEQQLGAIDDTLSQMATMESRFLKGDIYEDDVKWLDQGWDYSAKSLAMTRAWERGKKGEDFDVASEEELRKVLGETGRAGQREFRTGAPIADALDEATGGQFSFAPQTPVELKQVLWDTYEAIKAASKGVITDQQIWALILDDEQIGDIAKQYVVKKGGEGEEGPATVGETTPAIPAKPASPSAALREK